MCTRWFTTNISWKHFLTFCWTIDTKAEHIKFYKTVPIILLNIAIVVVLLYVIRSFFCYNKLYFVFPCIHLMYCIMVCNVECMKYLFWSQINNEKIKLRAYVLLFCFYHLYQKGCCCITFRGVNSICNGPQC